MSKLEEAVNHLALCLADERSIPNADHPGFVYKREETDRALEEVRLISGFYRPNNF